VLNYLAKAFWGEAIVTTNYLQNRSPTKAILDNKTPFELWFGQQPNLSYLNFFGSKGTSFNFKRDKTKVGSTFY